MAKKENQPRLLRMRNLTAYLALSRAYIYQKIAEGEFPPGKMNSKGVRIWDRETVDSWLDKRLGKEA